MWRTRLGYVEALAAGLEHTLSVMRDDSLWATGCNLNGQLGDGSTTRRSTFVQVISGGIDASTADTKHNMVLKQDGSVWDTGENKYDQLGEK